MRHKTLIKAFIAGMAFPAVFLPLAYTMLFFVEQGEMRMHALQFIPMYIPIVFGITNMLYVHISHGLSARKANAALWLIGAVLGFVVAVLGVFCMHIPTLVFGALDHNELIYLPVIALPIIYGFIFRFIVKPLNKLLAV